MRPFELVHAQDAASAIGSFASPARSRDDSAAETAAQYLAGGTTLIDLMKLDVMRPSRVVNINALQKSHGAIETTAEGLKLGALARMSETADHPDIRANFPVIAQSLQLAASAQIRNMASLGGNVLQRTRCPYFRDTSYTACNKRNPGSGCAALDGFNKQHAVLGASDHCIATYPGDFAVALLSLDAQVQISGPRGTRAIAFADLHRMPDQAPDVETQLQPGELIDAFTIPPTPFAKRSLYLKIRDRESYEFALASAAIVLDIDNGRVRQARIALGGVATVPWRSRDAEAMLVGKAIDNASTAEAAQTAFAAAQPRKHNAFKVELGKRTLIRALREAAALEIPA